MFGFGTSALATIALILGAPVAVCALLYVLVRLEPPMRRPMWLVGAEAVRGRPERPEESESAA